MITTTNKDKFTKLLLGTKRDGINNVIKNITELGFFEAPASTKYHGCYDGGLVEHCLNVYEQIMYLRKVEIKIRPDLSDKIKEDSCIIVSLLHDICKSNFYKKIWKWKKNDETNKWEQYQTYEQDYSYLPIGHGEKSCIMLLNFGLRLTDDEICAIRWHMSSFDLSQYPDASKGFNSACDNYPLASLLISADWLASRFTESKKEWTLNE